MNKKLKMVFMILSFFPFVMTLVLLPFLPDQLPNRLTAEDTALRFTSKYQELLLPVLIAACGLVLLAFAWRSINNQSANWKRNLLTTVSLLVLFGLNVLELSYVYRYFFGGADSVRLVTADPFRITFLVVGLLFLLVGFLVGRSKANLFKLPKEHERANRFADKLFRLCGILCLIGNSLFFKGFSSCIFSVLVIALTIILLLLYTKRRKNKEFH